MILVCDILVPWMSPSSNSQYPQGIVSASSTRWHNCNHWPSCKLSMQLSLDMNMNNSLLCNISNIMHSMSCAVKIKGRSGMIWYDKSKNVANKAYEILINLDMFAGTVSSAFYLIKKHRTSSGWVSSYWFGRKNEPSWICECDIETHGPETCYNNSNRSTLIGIENFVRLDNFVPYMFEWASVFILLTCRIHVTCLLDLRIVVESNES